MASLLVNNIQVEVPIILTIFFLLAIIYVFLFRFNGIPTIPAFQQATAFLSFCYTCFLKPHTGDGNWNQQEALESFYGAQASVYDATRARLLRGREDMLGLVASQLKHRAQTGLLTRRPVWLDVRAYFLAKDRLTD